MESPLSRRLFVRLVDGTDYLQLLAVSGITTVLGVRAFLYLTGYPQVGGDSLHIAHVLWGGLLMTVAVSIALLFVGRGARLTTAVLGGAGLGLFVDEVGKFVTNTNDYFYRPAASIIYVLFALLVLATALIERDKLTDRPERIVNAAVIATNGLTSGLTPAQRAKAEKILEGRNEPQAEAVRGLLNSIPDHAYSPPVRRFIDGTLALAERMAQRQWLTNVFMVVYVVQAAWFALNYVGTSLDLLDGITVAGVAERQAIYAIAVSDSLSAVMAAVGTVMLFINRTAAFRLLQVAVLINLLFGQIFNFTNDQFSAALGLPFNLVALAIATYELRRRTSPA
jgi:hypothetical protein